MIKNFKFLCSVLINDNFNFHKFPQDLQQICDEYDIYCEISYVRIKDEYIISGYKPDIKNGLWVDGVSETIAMGLDTLGYEVLL